MDMPIMPTGEELLETGRSTVSDAAKSAVSDVSNSVSGQIGLKNEANAQTQNQSQNQPQDQNGQQGESAQQAAERTKEMVKDFYSPSDDLPQNATQAEAATEEQRMAQVRKKLAQELHNEVYYEPLFAYEHNQNRVESKTEELEREEKEEAMDLQQKEADKPPPLAVSRAQTHTETGPGMSG